MIADIETSPNLGFFWRPGKQIITHNQIVEERQIICISWKWLGKDKVRHVDWGRDACDAKVLEKFMPEVEKADMIIAHNGDRFDWSWIRGRLLYHGMQPMAKVKQLDTLKEARKKFNLNSCALDYLSKYTGREGKIHVGYDLWKALMLTNKAKDRRTMVEYCDQDILVLEDVYLKMRPHLDNNLNFAIFNEDKRICPACGGKVHKHDQRYYTNVGTRQRYRCTECGHVAVSGKNLISKPGEYLR